MDYGFNKIQGFREKNCPFINEEEVEITEEEYSFLKEYFEVLTEKDASMVFSIHHRMMIQIQSSWFPLADRNPQKFVDIYKANESDFQKASIKIYKGMNATNFVLPVLK